MNSPTRKVIVGFDNASGQANGADLLLCPECEAETFHVYKVQGLDHPHFECALCGNTFCNLCDDDAQLTTPETAGSDLAHKNEIARCSALMVLHETLPVLRELLKRREDKLDSKRVFLRSVRDRLYRMCNHFEQHGLAEVCEPYYLPLFDALSHMTAAIQPDHVDARRVHKAHEELCVLAGLLKLTVAA
jgi:transposase-like protein